MTCSGGFILEDDISNLVTSIEQKLGLKSDSTTHDNFTKKSLEIVSELLVYLSFCPPKAEMYAARQNLEESINIYSPKEILIILNRLLHAEGTLSYREPFSKFLERIRIAWNLQFKEIQKLTTGLECDDCKATKVEQLMESQNLPKVTNHPVHIVNEDETISPSSLIPFCWFGDSENLSLKIENFSLPVCASFKPKLRNDQVCYEMDPNELLRDGQTANNIGLYLLIDENKDRQVQGTAEHPQNKTIHKRKEDFIIDFGNEKATFVYLETIGKIIAIQTC